MLGVSPHKVNSGLQCIAKALRRARSFHRVKRQFVGSNIDQAINGVGVCAQDIGRSSKLTTELPLPVAGMDASAVSAR